MKNMKKRLLCAAAVLLVVLGAAAAVGFGMGRRPLRNLEIASASVCLTPPDKTLQIADTDALTRLLNDVVTYRRDDSYTGYCGQGVTFTLNLRDGSQRTVGAYNPFVIIDGQGYRTEYAPCEALSAFANELLREDAPRLWTSPPRMDVVSDMTCTGSLLGGYSWDADNGDGTWTATEADAAHPLEPVYRDQLAALDTEEASAELAFQEAPRAVKLQAWPIEAVGDTGAQATEVAVHNGTFVPLEGSWLYEAWADWDAENFRGSASYVFWVDCAPN